jgi:acetylornithine deacetylase/succinyl-diaminopimelate desuccinylase-like protein
MYDVKQADPAEWSSPPFDARLVDRPGVGQVLVGRGATNQKGPQAALLAALHAFRGAGRPLPVNLVLIAEGEEEIGSPHLPQLMRRPDVQAAFSGSLGVIMPHPSQALDGTAAVFLGAKGNVECELVSSGEKWGRGPISDVHSGQAARLDSPVWHLVLALSSLVTTDGQPAIDGFADAAKPATPAEQALIAEMVRRADEAEQKKALGVTRWINDVSFDEAVTRFMTRPTVNIEGIVGGYTGPGGMTILPHRAVAKLDLRLVPDMTATGALAGLKAHLARRGFGDIEVTMTGGYDPTSTSAESALVRVILAVYRRAGLDPLVIPRNAASWPGYVFTGPPLRLPANHFGLGYGGRAHAPDEFFVIDPVNPRVQGFDGAARAFVEFLYGVAEQA